MAKRPTILDLASAANVSISTINRIIGGADNVRQQTREHVLTVAREIGFYGLGTIEHSVRSGRDVHRFGILLLQEQRPFYRGLGAALKQAAETTLEGNIELTITHLADLSPNVVADTLRKMGKSYDAVGIVSAEHPLVSIAIDEVLEAGTPVISMIVPLSARGNVGYVGLDNFKVGRTAAWAFDRLCKEPGEIGILVGSHRYRNQELNESGFRSYFREYNSNFTLLEPALTFESAAIAREMTEQLFINHPNMCGLFISGGGITGAIAALRDANRPPGFVAIGYEIMDVTRAALIDGMLDMVISHPIEIFASKTITTLIKAKKAGPESGALNVTFGFDIYTRENV